MKYIPPPSADDYDKQVWQIARQVPYGEVATYGQIADMISPPEGIKPQDYKAFSARWVGNAMAACPPDVPWQRVINSQGKISQRPGAETQRSLLEEEGVVFTKDKINLTVYQWRSPGQEDEPRQGRLF